MGTSLGIMTNATSIASIVTTGLCDRFPRLKFVSVESGFGYITYLLESLDWHWQRLRGPPAVGNAPERIFSTPMLRVLLVRDEDIAALGDVSRQLYVRD